MSHSRVLVRSRPEARNALHIAQRSRCGICGKPFSAGLRVTFDHVEPIALGGSRKFHNLVLAHEPCNRAKGDRAPRPCEIIFREATHARAKLKRLGA